MKTNTSSAKMPSVPPGTEQTLPAREPGSSSVLKNLLSLKEWVQAPGPRELLQTFTEKARQTLDYSAALSWAQKLGNEYPAVRRMRPDSLASSIQRLEPDAQASVRVEKDEDGSTAVFVFFGGGFQRWGVAFTTNEALLNRIWIETEKVTNGIYTFVSVESQQQPLRD